MRWLRYQVLEVKSEIMYARVRNERNIMRPGRKVDDGRRDGIRARRKKKDEAGQTNWNRTKDLWEYWCIPRY